MPVLGPADEVSCAVYLNPRLWAFTRGVRLRIAGTTLAGLLAVLAGTARLALLGWVLGRVLAGDSLATLAWPVAGVAALIALRGVLEYWRTMVAHHTAARVQRRLRGRLYEQITALGPAHFTQTRTGDVILSVVEGVQQLEVYFGQFLPQLFVSALTPFLIFAVVATIDLPLAFVFLVAAIGTFLMPTLWHRWDSRHSLARSKILRRLRRRVPRRDPGAAHAGRVRPEPVPRAAARGARAGPLPGHHVAAQHQHARARHQRRRASRWARRPRSRSAAIACRAGRWSSPRSWWC